MESTIKKKSILAIGGMTCCGKSETIRGLQKFLGLYRHYSSGDTVRELAAKAQVSIEHFREHAKRNHIDFDKKVDDRLKEIGDTENYFLIDSRLGYHFIPQSFKVFLKVDPIIGAQRRLKDLQKNNFEQYSSYTVEDVLADNQRRDLENNAQYQKLYNITYTDESNYDLVVDTTHMSVREVVYFIITKYMEWLNSFVFN